MSSAPDRPGASLVGLLVLSFAAACVCVGLALSTGTSGALLFHANASFQAGRNATAVITPFELDDSGEVMAVFQAVHRQPEDAPTSFSLDWTLTDADAGEPVHGGTLDWSHEQLRAADPAATAYEVSLADLPAGNYQIALGTNSSGWLPEVHVLIVGGRTQPWRYVFAAALFGLITLGVFVQMHRRHPRWLRRRAMLDSAETETPR